MKDWIYSILTTVLGVVLLALGISGLSSTDVTCGGQTMSSGDRCVEMKSGRETDLEQTRSENRTGNYSMLGGGAAALIGGGIWIAMNARRTGRRRANGGPHPATVVGAGIPPQPYPQAGQPHSPHYPQQPGQDPQAGQPRPSQYPHHQPYVGHPQSSPRGPSSGYGGGPSPLGAQPPAPGAPPKIDYRK